MIVRGGVSADPEVSISVVSHGQANLVTQLLEDLVQHVETGIELLVTINVPEAVSVQVGGLPFPNRIIENGAPKGFGANHNAAFRISRGRHFCVLNPDIRLATDPFPALMRAASHSATGVVAPLVCSPAGDVEDSARRFPTPLTILSKAIRGRATKGIGGAAQSRNPDWVAGMFMLFRREVFEAFDGFDERYFLYYEDVDLCARMYLQGKRAVVVPEVSVIHAARRQSHRELRYFKWHLRSMARFFVSPAFRSICWRRLVGAEAASAEAGR